MINLFITIIFISELIVASAIILHIFKINTSVNNYSKYLIANKRNIITNIRNHKFVYKSISEKTLLLRYTIKKAKEEYILRFIKTLLSYAGILSLKGNYKKMFIAYQFGREVFEAIKEA